MGSSGRPSRSTSPGENNGVSFQERIEDYPSSSSLGGGAIRLLHVPELVHPWADNEMSVLEDAFSRLSSENMSQPLIYLKIATLLPQKTARDVAVRCWQLETDSRSGHGLMNGNGNGNGPIGSGYGSKRKKGEENGQGKKLKDKRTPEAVHKTQNQILVEPQQHVSPMDLSLLQNAVPDEIHPPLQSYSAAELIDKNEELLIIIKQNMDSDKVEENNDVFCQLRDNMLSVLNEMTVMPGIMSQMPPLPVKLNLELANQILHDPMTAHIPTQL